MILNITKLTKDYKISGIILVNEPLWKHTSLQIGGSALLFTIPKDIDDLQNILQFCKDTDTQYSVLGGGTNLLVSDEGFDGLIINLQQFNKYSFHNNILEVGAGMDVSQIAWESGMQGYQGLEFIFGMPGRIGGAIWMNARCYNKEISEILLWTDIMYKDGTIERIHTDQNQWDYKYSPFQNQTHIIIGAGFQLKQGNVNDLRTIMLKNRNDRLLKGHYRAACAGSAFKNNRNFGKPSGAIIDECGLRGLCIGNAKVSDWHANIFINRGGATASDFSKLMFEVAKKVKNQTGFQLEPEIIKLGHWKEEYE